MNKLYCYIGFVHYVTGSGFYLLLYYIGDFFFDRQRLDSNREFESGKPSLPPAVILCTGGNGCLKRSVLSRCNSPRQTFYTAHISSVQFAHDCIMEFNEGQR